MRVLSSVNQHQTSLGFYAPAAPEQSPGWISFFSSCNSEESMRRKWIRRIGINLELGTILAGGTTFTHGRPTTAKCKTRPMSQPRTQRLICRMPRCYTLLSLRALACPEPCTTRLRSLPSKSWFPIARYTTIQSSYLSGCVDCGAGAITHARVMADCSYRTSLTVTTRSSILVQQVRMPR